MALKKSKYLNYVHAQYFLWQESKNFTNNVNGQTILKISVEK